MNEVYCSDCKYASTCEEPFPDMHCEKYEKRITPAEVLELFRGMSPSMQKAIIEIMRVTQNDETRT